jgi:hypothetical protein
MSIGMRDLKAGSSYLHRGGLFIRTIHSIDGEDIHWSDHVGSGVCTRKVFIRQCVDFAPAVSPVIAKFIEALDGRAYRLSQSEVLSGDMTLRALPSLSADTFTKVELRYRSPREAMEVRQCLFPLLLFRFMFSDLPDWGALMQRVVESTVQRRRFSETVAGWDVTGRLDGDDTVLALSRSKPPHP